MESRKLTDLSYVEAYTQAAKLIVRTIIAQPTLMLDTERLAREVFGEKEVDLALKFVEIFLPSVDDCSHTFFDLAITFPVRESYTENDYQNFIHEIAHEMFLLRLNGYFYMRAKAGSLFWSRMNLITEIPVLLIQGILSIYFGKTRGWRENFKLGISWYWTRRCVDYYQRKVLCPKPS
jgi:hypothetical protein